MARQKGILEITGTMGNLTFYKSQDGMMVKEKSEISKEKIMTDPSFQRTRENMQEFANAGKGGKMLMDRIRTFMIPASDNRVSSRLAQAMRKVLNEDRTSKRGERSVALGIKTDAGKNVLRHFNFNKNSVLGSVLFRPIALDTTTGEIGISNVTPVNNIVGPTGATHVSLSCVFATIEFTTGRSWAEYSEVVELPLDATTSEIRLIPDEVPTLTPDTTSFYFIKLEFYQEVNGAKYMLNNDSYNCMELIEVQ